MFAPMTYQRVKDRRGLTMVELMVVIGIIAVLVTLIIAVVPRMRAAGRKASVQQQINTLQSAIDAYFLDYRAYPGPLADASVYAATGLPTNISGRPTQAENLVLGLLGGLRRVGNDLSYDPDRVGKGAVNFLPEAPSMPKPYMDVG